MAEVITTVMSAIATNASRLPDLTIKNGQLIFVKDKHFIALDIGKKEISSTNNHSADRE